MIEVAASPAVIARSAHEAMATLFDFRVAGAEPRYARQAMAACFAEVDRLETLLSRFVEGSDVWRINRLRAGESLRLSEECYACLREAERVWRLTGGLFDVSVGKAAAARKRVAAAATSAASAPAAGRFVLHPHGQWITCDQEGREIDLGGIGKGFALDRAAALLADWDIGTALLSAGGSTVLAVAGENATGAAGEGWRIGLRGTGAAVELRLGRGAVSASGTGVQGAHIVDPCGGGCPGEFVRVWVVVAAGARAAARPATAAVADAYSTACFLMSEEELARFAPPPTTGPPGIGDRAVAVQAVYVERRTGGRPERIKTPVICETPHYTRRHE